MLIQVAYPDNRFDYVNEHALQVLIESKEIVEFKRSSGWVTIGLDPVRQFKRGSHQISDYNFNEKSMVEDKNMIRVVYTDNRHDYVTDEMLVKLIETKKIAKYMVSTGWVSVGVEFITAVNFEHNYRNLIELESSAE